MPIRPHPVLRTSAPLGAVVVALAAVLVATPASRAQGCGSYYWLEVYPESGPLPPGEVGRSYDVTLTACCNGTFLWETDPMPPGLYFRVLTTYGEWVSLSGVPGFPGVQTVQLRVTLAECNWTLGLVYTIDVQPGSCQTLTIDPAQVPDGHVGQPYSQQLTASGGAPPYVYGVTSGSLPPGIALSPTGLLSGAPIAGGVYSFTVTAVGASYCGGERSYSLNVDCFDLEPLDFTATVGDMLDVTLPAGGAVPPVYFAIVGGAPPPGIALSTSGRLSGRPTTRGDFSFSARAQDSAGCSDTESYSTVVYESPGYLTGPGPDPAAANEVHTFTRRGAAPAASFFAYAAGSYGTNVAAGDVRARYVDAILTGPGPGPRHGPQVRAFDGNGIALPGLNFFAYGTPRNGVRIAAADVDSDRIDEILTGPGPGTVFGPHVRGFDFDGNTIRPAPGLSFYAYASLRYGVVVNGGDVAATDGDEIVTTPGPGSNFAPTVRAFDYDPPRVTFFSGLSFDAFSIPGFGARAAVGDLVPGAGDEVVVAMGPGPTFPATMRAFALDAAGATPLAGYLLTPFPSLYGGSPGLGDIDGDALAELLAGAGPDPAASARLRVLRYEGVNLRPLPVFLMPFPSSFGVNPGSGRLAL